MQLPEELQDGISALALAINPSQLARATEKLSLRYRAQKTLNEEAYMSNDEERIAYITYRMPATFCVNLRVFEELSARHPGVSYETLLDLGSGPGTAAWAACTQFHTIKSCTLMEQDFELIKIGKKLAGFSKREALVEAEWRGKNLIQDVGAEDAFPIHDLVVMSYAIGELPPDLQLKLIQRAWQATSKALVIIEPGTPIGFERIRAIRASLIEQGAHIVAPCPHNKACPMSGGDWCHFAQRVQRTSLHRMVKGGELGYEDEKYSYVIAEKPPLGEQALGRILRHPQKHSGHMEMIVCAVDGLKDVKLSRRHGEAYKKARKLEWGDSI